MTSIEHAYQKFCKSRFPAVEEQQIINIESKLQRRLPCSYRTFLSQYNGGLFIEPAIVFNTPIPVQWRGQTVIHETDSLISLYGCGATQGFAELAKDSDLALFDGNMPVELLPIGNTVTGSLLLLDCVTTSGEVLIKFPNEKAYLLSEDIAGLFSLLQSPRAA